MVDSILCLIPPANPQTQEDNEDYKVLHLTVLPQRRCREDHRLAERVRDALRVTGYGSLRDIEVSVDERIVDLCGDVPSYHLKQIAQVTALATPGTHGIRNKLKVI
jgi:osmotically-inducible protein OsmY